MAAPSSLPPPAVDAELFWVDGPVGEIAVYRSEGRGPALLLVHSINAAASAFEMKTIFEAFRASRRVYVFDLPGFGRSKRPDVCYDVRLYTDTVLSLMETLAQEVGSDSVDVASLSLSSEFAARAAVERPELVRRLVMITPTGFSRGSEKLVEAGQTREVAGFDLLFGKRPWAKPLFGLLTTKASVRYFMKRTFGSEGVDPALIEYAYLSARSEGAQYAPLSFLSGRLFSKDIRQVYAALTQPVWVPHGTKGDFRDFSESEWARQRDAWRFDAFETGAMPHWEDPEAFMDAMRGFLEATRESSE